MALSPSRKVVALVAAVAVLFGVATLVAGSRVLLGSDPGYAVFTPLLLFNTLMGFAYIAVGGLAWRRTPLAVRGAAVIALLNVAVLGGIALLYTRGEIGLNAKHVANGETESNAAIENFIVAQAIEINPAGAGLQLAVWPRNRRKRRIIHGDIRSERDAARNANENGAGGQKQSGSESKYHGHNLMEFLSRIAAL